jgi:MinD superfamily P-loop ATPase
VPVIKKLLNNARKEKQITFIDCPPRTACTVMESIKDADYCILVAEPTLFGCHNLNMVLELVTLFNKPHGAVINKYMEGENLAEIFCMEKGVKVLGSIPFDKAAIKAVNSGKSIVDIDCEAGRAVKDIFHKTLKLLFNNNIK